MTIPPEVHQVDSALDPMKMHAKQNHGIGGTEENNV